MSHKTQVRIVLFSCTLNYWQFCTKIKAFPKLLEPTIVKLSLLSIYVFQLLSLIAFIIGCSRYPNPKPYHKTTHCLSLQMACPYIITWHFPSTPYPGFLPFFLWIWNVPSILKRVVLKISTLTIVTTAKSLTTPTTLYKFFDCAQLSDQDRLMGTNGQ